MKKANEGYHFCRKCIDEQISDDGFSYWLRFHQIPGAFWCLKHDLPLQSSGIKDPYLCSPHKLNEQGQYLDKYSGNNWLSPAIRKYLILLEDVLRGQFSLSESSATKII